MVYGGAETERIALSEATAWSGAPGTNEVNPDARAHLSEMRQLFFDGKYEEFQRLCSEYLPGRGKNFGTNLPLPELQLTFENGGGAAGYRRSLDLETAIAGIHFRSGDATFTREIFASHPHRVLVIRLTCSRPGRHSLRMGFGKSVLPGAVSTQKDTAIFQGNAYEHIHSSGHDGVALEIHARLIADGSNVTPDGAAVRAHGADSVTILVAIGTSFHGGEPSSICRERLRHAASIPFPQLRRTHIADHQALYRRV
jgi:alpha-L-fucosidase 2